MYVTSISSKFYVQVFISLKIISVLQKKRNRRDEKEVNKKKNKAMTQLLEACVPLPITSTSLVPFFIQFSFQKNINILLFQKQILLTDFIIIHLQTISKATVI